MPKKKIYTYLLVCLNYFVINSEAILDGNGHAKVGDYPSTVAITRWCVNDWWIIGTGVLVTPFYVLGSRLFDQENFDFKQIKIIAGSIDWKNSSISTRQERLVEYTFDRRQYGTELLIPLEMYRVNKPFNRNPAIKFPTLDYRIIRYGWRVHGAGYGKSNSDEFYSTRILSWGEWKTVPKSRCNIRDSALWGEYFCVLTDQSPGKLFAGYDYGAPIYYQNRVVGLASPLGKYTTLTYNTIVRLNPFQDWIAQNAAWDGKGNNHNAIPIAEGRSLRRRKSSQCTIHQNFHKTLFWLMLSILYC